MSCPDAGTALQRASRAGQNVPVGADRPDENEAERADRNFLELLQELRVVQTGVQILFAFLLTLPFQSGFDQLDGNQRRVYVAAVMFAVGSVSCLIAPVAYHRALFRMKLKDDLVTIAGRFAIAGLGLLAAAIVTAVGLVLSFVLGAAAAWGFVAALALTVLTVWLVMPLVTRRKHEHGTTH